MEKNEFAIMVEFGKYEKKGAYHWDQADSHWRNTWYNAPLVARYTRLVDQISAPPRATGRLLDVGCGDGYLLHLLLEKGFRHVTGIDSNLIGCRLAFKRLQKHHLLTSFQIICGSAYELPFTDLFFETVTAADVIEHLEFPDRVLREISRVLTNSGTLLLSTPNSQPNGVWDRHHVCEFSPDTLKQILLPHFKDVRILGCWPMRWLRLWRRGGLVRVFCGYLFRTRLNPFKIITKNISPEYGQLIAVCRK